MPGTPELIVSFELLLSRGFSIPNARRMVERMISGPKQREQLKEALDRLEKEKRDAEDV